MNTMTKTPALTANYPLMRALLAVLLVEIDADPHAEDDPDLRHLNGVCVMAAWADKERFTGGARARAAGATWPEIGRVAGISAGSAVAAFSPGREERLRRMAERSAKRVIPSTPANLPGVGVAEAARRLDVTNATVYARADRGELESVVVSGRKRFITPEVKGDCSR